MSRYQVIDGLLLEYSKLVNFRGQMGWELDQITHFYMIRQGLTNFDRQSRLVGARLRRLRGRGVFEQLSTPARDGPYRWVSWRRTGR